MGQTKPGARYQSVSLAIPFIEEIKKHIQDRPEYRSIADFMRQAARAQMQYEDSKIWSETATRDRRKLKRFFTKKQNDQDEVIDTVIEKPIDDKKNNEVLNALEELIRNIVREEKAKK